MNKKLYILITMLLFSQIFAAPKQATLTLSLDQGYFIQHKPEELTTDLGVFFKSLEQWHRDLTGKELNQSEYDHQLLLLFITAIESGFQDELVKQLRRIFNKGAIERLLEKTDLEEGLVELIGDVEIDLIEKFREFIRKRIEMRIAQLSETEFGQKLEDLKDKIDHLPPFIKNKIETLILKLLERSEHLPESVKEKIKEYATAQAQERENESYITVATNYATAPFSYVSGLISDTFWSSSKDEA